MSDLFFYIFESPEIQFLFSTYPPQWARLNSIKGTIKTKSPHYFHLKPKQERVLKALINILRTKPTLS